MNNKSITSHYYCATGISLDLELGLIANSAGESQRLSPLNLKLLTCLLDAQGAVLSRSDIFDRVWPNQIIGDDVLTRAISDIRAQLSRLDAETKYIETLPKRGYRWVVDAQVLPIVESAGLTSQLDLMQVQDTYRLETMPVAGQFLKRFLLACALGLMFAFGFMWAISRPAQHQLNLVVLPCVVDAASLAAQSKLIDRQMLQALRSNKHINLLSGTAIASHPANPFPYFYSELGAAAVLESRVSHLETGVSLELNLVDARTGLEIRSITLEANNNVELFSRLARLLEYEWLPDWAVD